MANYDELVQIRQQAAHQRMLQGFENQRQANWNDYCQALSENDVDKAAWAEAEYLKNTKDLGELLGHRQQAQPQQQFSGVERQILKEFPGVAGDPKKWNEALAAANALVMRGYDRNSAEYDSAMRTALGLAGPDGRDGPEIASADTALEAVNNSQIARKYGPVTPDQYNANAQWLHANKKSEPK